MDIGNTVVLKSNPEQKMTVDVVKSCDLVECVWFEKGNFKRDTFSTNSLLIENQQNPSKNFLFG